MTLWHRTFVSIGANKGVCEKTIKEICQHIASLPDVKDFALSSLWRTSPVGVCPQEDFLNCVCSFSTLHSPQALFSHLTRIEKEYGRTEKGQGLPRTIDLDLLLVGHCFLQTPSLTLPHPRMLDRLFVLLPLCELLDDEYLEIPTSFEPQKVNISDHIQRLKETTDQRAEKILSANPLKHPSLKEH